MEIARGEVRFGDDLTRLYNSGGGQCGQSNEAEEKSLRWLLAGNRERIEQILPW